MKTINSKHTKLDKYLAYKYGTWFCNYCNVSNLIVGTTYKTGRNGDSVEICPCCGQANEEELEDYNEI